MKMRLIEEKDLQSVHDLVHYTYSQCDRQFVQNPMFEQGFLSYIRTENLRKLFLEKELVLWGVFDVREILFAVGGMHANGGITLLFVHPSIANRGYGKALLEVMRQYAFDKLEHKTVVAKVFPTINERYFARRGFSPNYAVPCIRGVEVPMMAKVLTTKTYTDKKLSLRFIFISLLIMLVLIVILTIIGCFLL